jgi:hypothetical protein
MLAYLNKTCSGNRARAECRSRDYEVSEDCTLEMIDAIHKGFSLCCGLSFPCILIQRNARMTTIDIDHVMPCVEANNDHVVEDCVLSDRPCHTVTSPRACDVPICEFPTHWYHAHDRDVHDVCHDELPTVVRVIDEEMGDGDGGDA